MTIEPIDVLIVMNVIAWAGALSFGARVKRLEKYGRAHYKAIDFIGKRLEIEVWEGKRKKANEGSHG